MYLKSSLIQFFFYAHPSREENSDKFIQGQFCRLIFWIFSSKRQLSIFFNFHFSFVHFIDAFYGHERKFADFALILPALAQFFGVHPRANGRWLTDQSKRAFYDYSTRTHVWLCMAVLIRRVTCKSLLSFSGQRKVLSCEISLQGLRHCFLQGRALVLL